ncbi:hypothetical protein ACH4NO_17860 [Streptomyces olivaceus]|uniref:hypothetical protein n=1 Tax=Streptomyces olivaceus TaxID=47716 RepID=UPI0004CA8306|nr:hypothetical protein [Streptomyces olivaceus]MBZ6102672.1 hypothetical protein [Streptomyces olivaceus]
MPAISVGSVEVDVLPNARGIHRRLRSALVPTASQIGDEVGRIIGQQLAARIAPAVRDGVQNGARAARPSAARGGEETGGAFARSLRARLEAAFRSMPKLNVGLNDTGVDADLARLRAKLESLAGKTIGIDIDAETARAQAADIEERLRRIGAAHPDVAVRADTARAIAQLRLLREQIDEVSADPLRIRVETDGAFGQRLRAQIQAAEESLPNINITADSSRVDVEIARLRAKLTELKDKRIGIDIDAATAQAQLAEIRDRLFRISGQRAQARVDADTGAADAALYNIGVRLDRLRGRRAEVNVRADAASAYAQLATVQAAVNRLDGQTASVNVRVNGMQLLIGAAVALGPALLPVLPVAAAGLGAIAAAATAAAVGIGSIALVAVPAFMQMSKVMQAQKAAQDAATQASLQGGQASAQGAQKAMQMAGAQQSLATAHRNAARQIRQAEQSVGDAVRTAAEANERAAGQVAQAKRALSDAVQQAADRQRQAAEQVATAEESLADAQRDAIRAQEDLTDARAAAAQELADMESRLANAKLSERDATLSVQEAEQKLRAVQAAGANASELDRQRAQLAYDQAVQRLKDQRSETKDLAAEKKAADAAGVDGSERVRDAQERLQDAEKRVTDQQKTLTKARQEAARQQVQAQRDIADAQGKVAEAQRNVARTQEDGARSVARAQDQLAQAQQSAADSIASAQRQIASASLSAAGGVDQAAIAQAKYQAELAKLTPAARETYDAVLGLKDAFSAWSRSLQPAVMPLFTRAINGLKNSLPGLTPFVLAAAGAIGRLQDRVSRGFKSPWWKGFKQDLQGSVDPAIEGLGVSFGRVFKGMAGVVQAFLPHMDSISSRMQDLTGRFATWGTGLKGSPEFERFLDYSAEMGPRLGAALRELAGAAVSVAQALIPVQRLVLSAVEQTAAGIGWIADKAPWVIQGIYGIVVAMTAWRLGLVLWRGAMTLASAAMAAFNLVTAAGPWGWIVIAVAAVVAVIVLLYTKCEWFRDAVKAVWLAIQLGAKVVKDWLAGPFATFWTRTLPAVFKAGWVLVKTWVIYPIRDYFTKTIPGWANTLKSRFVKAWVDVSVGALNAWRNLKSSVIWPIRDFFTKTIPGWGRTLKSNMVEAFASAAVGIKNAFNKIRGYAKDPVQFVVDTVYNNGIRGVWNKIAGAFGAKKLPWFKFASGGVMPGYTPGRDVHTFYSPTGGGLALSGGEAIMRPEFTRAVGSGFVNTMNSVAKSQGTQGVKAALAPVFGGNPMTPTDRSLKYASGGTYPMQRFADGGIFGWIKDAASSAVGAGSKAWNAIKAGASWLKDGLENSARAGVKHVVDPLLKRFPGMDTGFGQMIRKVPDKIIDALFGYSKEADKKGGGGIGGPRIQAALKWVKTQNGLPYQWAGNGNPSWDCSGLMSAIESVIRGQKPHRRWATMAFSGRTAPPGWVYHGNSPFKIGITNAGVGHTAGTLGKTNVESRGGDGVVVGPRARSYKDSLFTSWYGFQPGKYDNGGMLQPGFNLAYNGTGRPEPVLTGRQFNDLARGGGDNPVTVEIHTQDRALADFIDVRVLDSQQQLIQVIKAN